MAKKKIPELTFKMIKSFADPKTSDEDIKEILFGNLDEEGFSNNAIRLFRPLLGYYDFSFKNPKKFIEAVKIYCTAVERALSVCGDDLLFYFRMFGNDCAGSVNPLFSSVRALDSCALNKVGTGLYVQNDIVCQYVLVNQDKYPLFAGELCKYNNKVIDNMAKNWKRPYNLTEEYTEDDITITPLSLLPLNEYLCDGSPLHFSIRTSNNETDHIEIAVYVARCISQYLCQYNPCAYSNLGSDNPSSNPEIVLDVVGCSQEQSKDFAEFVTKGIGTILNMIKKNLLIVDDFGYMYYGYYGENIDSYDWNEDVIPYIDLTSCGGKRVVEILMSDEIDSDDYKFFDDAFTKNGFKDCGITPYVTYDEDDDEVVANMHRYYQVIEVKEILDDMLDEEEDV